ncbi:MAG: hypothetical protein DDT28_00518 [Dehalococcoidia bacterium]|nr:hypothetical protein [Chloroflexota bacterium]
MEIEHLPLLIYFIYQLIVGPPELTSPGSGRCPGALTDDPDKILNLIECRVCPGDLISQTIGQFQGLVKTELHHQLPHIPQPFVHLHCEAGQLYFVSIQLIDRPSQVVRHIGEGKLAQPLSHSFSVFSQQEVLRLRVIPKEGDRVIDQLGRLRVLMSHRRLLGQDRQGQGAKNYHQSCCQPPSPGSHRPSTSITLKATITRKPPNSTTPSVLSTLLARGLK